MSQINFSRRNFILGLAGGLGTLWVGRTLFSSFLAGSKNQNLLTDGNQEVMCPIDETIDETSRKARAAVKYVDKSDISTRNCANCKLYKSPINKPTCGGCQLFSGLVNPAGYCESWYRRM